MKKIDELLDKAETFLSEGFEKAKESETYAKISGAMGQVGEFVDKKIVELKEGDLPDKMENLRDKAEIKAETIIDQAKAYGNLLAGDVEEVIDHVKEKLSGDSKKK